MDVVMTGDHEVGRSRSGELVPSLALSREDCRRAADSLRRAERGRGIIDELRPRSTLWFGRERLPLTWQLWLRARQGRVVWSGPDVFVLLNAPVVPPRRGVHDEIPRVALRVRLLGVVDEAWSSILLIVTFGSLFFVAWLYPQLHIGSPNARYWVGHGLIAALVVYLWALMLNGLVNAYRDTVQNRGKTRLQRAALRVGRGLVTTVAFHCVPHQAAVGLARQVVASLRQQHVAPARFCVLASSTTSNDSRRELERSRSVRPLPGGTALVVGERGPLPDPRVVRLPRWSIVVVLVAVITVVFMFSGGLADVERAACATRECTGGEPTTAWTMAYWLITRLVSAGDPNGIGPSSWLVRSLGITLSVVGPTLFLFLLGQMWAAVGERDRSDTGEVLMSANARETASASRERAARRRRAVTLGSTIRFGRRRSRRIPAGEWPARDPGVRDAG